MTDRNPLKPKSESPSLNSEIFAATEIQSQVTPEDYPLDQRARIDPDDRAARPSKAR
jgi:hypothetical protein